MAKIEESGIAGAPSSPSEIAAPRNGDNAGSFAQAEARWRDRLGKQSIAPAKTSSGLPLAQLL